MSEPIYNDFYIAPPPPVQYRLHLVDGFLIDITKKPPCLLHRWAMRLAFGWRFEIL